MHLPIRLDWLYLKGLTPLDWNVDNVPLSDHRGIWAKAER
jgi:endonuclease/exonuclease/phosphatase (EEP) superfamily protein YafD